jgi:hypothetical protein
MEFELEKEMSGMCNLSAGVWNRSAENTLINNLRTLMANLHFTFEQAANALGLSEVEKAEYINKM